MKSPLDVLGDLLCPFSGRVITGYRRDRPLAALIGPGIYGGKPKTAFDKNDKGGAEGFGSDHTFLLLRFKEATENRKPQE